MDFDFGGFDDGGMGGYDWGADIGIDPGSIDYGTNVGSPLSNEALWDQINGGDWNSGNFTGWDGGATPQATNDGGGALSMAASQEGSPNVNGVSDPEAKRLLSGTVTAGGDKSSVMGSIGKALGLTNKSGEFDFSDPKTLDKLIKLGVGLGGIAQSMGASRQQRQAQQQAQLQNQLQNQSNNTWTPQQSVWANKFFQTPTNPNRGVVRAGEGGIQSIVPSRGYADGGEVEGFAPEPDTERPQGNGGAFGLIEGAGTGQSDDIDIKAARGEYILDAETVSMIGDGSNEAGAEILDKWREYLRDHKRSAPNDKIAPPAKDPMAYMPEGAK